MADNTNTPECVNSFRWQTKPTFGERRFFRRRKEVAYVHQTGRLTVRVASQQQLRALDNVGQLERETADGRFLGTTIHREKRAKTDIPTLRSRSVAALTL